MTKLLTVALAVTASASAITFWSNTQGATALPLPQAPISLAGAWLRGSPRASLAILEFSDFDCRYCRALAEETIVEVSKRFGSGDDGILIAFRHFPLEHVHPFARKLAAVADCAGAQGRFWEMHDLLFARQRAFDSAVALERLQTSFAVDSKAFSQCVDGLNDAHVASDIAEGRALHITGTPTVFVGRHLGGFLVALQTFVGYQRPEATIRMIESLSKD